MLGLFLAALIWLVARNPGGEAVALRPVPTEQPLVVHITGAVPRPGIYAMPKGSRVQDVISAAGGFLAEADKSNINLAERLEDGQRLDIPYGEGGSILIPTPGERLVPSGDELVNINTASSAELDTLPGIGPTTAQKIIDYRTQNGPFQAIKDIMNVSGIGPGTFERIKDKITVGS